MDGLENIIPSQTMMAQQAPGLGGMPAGAPRPQVTPQFLQQLMQMRSRMQGQGNANDRLAPLAARYGLPAHQFVPHPMPQAPAPFRLPPHLAQMLAPTVAPQGLTVAPQGLTVALKGPGAPTVAPTFAVSKAASGTWVDSKGLTHFPDGAVMADGPGTSPVPPAPKGLGVLPQTPVNGAMNPMDYDALMHPGTKPMYVGMTQTPVNGAMNPMDYDALMHPGTKPMYVGMTPAPRYL